MSHGGTNFYRHRYRCNKCKHRFAVHNKKRKPTECPLCGANIHSTEGQRQRELAKQERCYCHPIPFPHRKGSVLGCEHHAKDFDDWTENDHQQYQYMLETPRSG